MDELEKKQLIADKLGAGELLTAIAEEASELAQAALKLRRAMYKVNYTPNSEGLSLKNLAEEIADLELCLDVLMFSLPINNSFFIQDEKTIIKDKKLDRWVERLKINKS